MESLLGFKPSVILTEAQQIAGKFKSVAEAEEAKKLLDAKNNAKLNKSEGIKRGIGDVEDLQKNVFPQDNPVTSFDEDEELKKGIEELKEQLKIKKNRVDLVKKINDSVKHSYAWFEAYLELLTTYGEKQAPTKQKSISFEKIKPYKQGNNNYFLLCGASGYISSEIENASDFKISVIFGDGKKQKIDKIDSVSKKGQDLLIFCPAGLPSGVLSLLSKIFKVEINFTPVIDLLDRLSNAFKNNNNINSWDDIKVAMPPLNYIYGPPGTGKTTTLCNKINSIIKENPNAKILVLTPTNKAADVVCKKLLEINSSISSVRLSRATDPELEQGIYRDTINTEDMGSINVVASTIHRLPYFEIKEAGLLFQYKWDYVIFDESSMTGLHYITFAIMALFKTNPETEFIVAGDPKQIPPVIGIDDKELESVDFQDENIYKMMGLESFKSVEQQIRECDTIKNLDTQYRSVPNIGKLFSELSYSGLLKHEREKDETKNKPKSLPDKIKSLISSDVTFIDIPLDKDNSIYKVNKLFYSSYHTYCAILVSEIIKCFDKENSAEGWSIGLIAPYKAQAILLNKLITSYGISKNITVYSDTVHGFQGDECDIVFFVCNPNNYFYSEHAKALLSKEYIYNVAISRARDYLVILHPYSTIKHNPFIKNIVGYYEKNVGKAEKISSEYIEEILFGDKKHIENNSYFSGHDSVNVFGLSEMKYFIKANDTAIDIQLRKDLEETKNDTAIEIPLREDLEEVKTTNPTSENDLVGAKTPVLSGLTILGKIDLSQFANNKKK